MIEPITVTLNKPITVDGRTISQVTVEEPDVQAQMDYVDKLEEWKDHSPAKLTLELTVHWLARLSELTSEQILKLKIQDFERLTEAVETVMGYTGSEEGEGNETPAT